MAAATHNLCDAANALVQGQATEEKLISSAKQVASSTAQLLVACKVKADPNSLAMRRLQVQFLPHCHDLVLYQNDLTNHRNSFNSDSPHSSGFLQFLLIQISPRNWGHILEISLGKSTEDILS